MAITLNEMHVFAKKHPELGRHIAELLGTYKKCQMEHIVDAELSLDAIYDHIYVRNGGCPWCMEVIEMFKNHKQEILKEANERTTFKERIICNM